jgi:membrane protein YdbS with pleckstrin-like domain
MSEPWFGQKAYGIGLSPRSPAGWAATVVYILALVATVAIVKFFAAPRWAMWAAFAVLSLGFIALTIIKSDRKAWRWRWGGR